MGTTNQMGIPYPENTDFVADGATNMKDIAEQVDTKTGLVLVKTDSITSGSSKEITGAFSSLFENYKIVLSNIKLTGTINVEMRMGTTSSGSLYYWSGLQRTYAGTTLGEQGAAANSWLLGIVGSTGNEASGVIDLCMPELAKPTTFNCLGQDPRTSGGGGARHYSGFINNTTQYTSFTILIAASAFTSCDIKVYGYNQ